MPKQPIKVAVAHPAAVIVAVIVAVHPAAIAALPAVVHHREHAKSKVLQTLPIAMAIEFAQNVMEKRNTLIHLLAFRIGLTLV